MDLLKQARMLEQHMLDAMSEDCLSLANQYANEIHRVYLLSIKTGSLQQGEIKEILDAANESIDIYAQC